MSAFWQDRRVFVTGATGLVGSWLVAGAARGGRRTWPCLVRDWDPQSELIRSGAIRAMHVVTGGWRTTRRSSARSDEYEIDTVFHLGAQTIVGIAHRSPLRHVRGQHPRAPTTCSRPAGVHAGLVKRVVVASSDKAYGDARDAPLHRGHAARRAATRTTSRSPAPTCSRRRYAATYGLPVAITRCGNIYGGGDLNWNRIVPGTIRVRRSAASAR